MLAQSKPKSARYKDKWAVEIFRTWQAAHEPKFCILDPGSMFKDYDLHRVQSLEEKLEDLDSLFQEVANKNGGRYPPRSSYGIVCSVTEASGSGSTVSETIEIVNSARRMFNSRTFLNCTVNVNVNSKQ